MLDMLPPLPAALPLLPAVLPADGLVADGLLDLSVPAALAAKGRANAAATATAIRVFELRMVFSSQK
ncbi:MAG TPA: hypothetical protein VFY80_08285 [Burkholderiales bacterium]|nr:hypothetical protein [Burkholderiales bacterium]